MITLSLELVKFINCTLIKVNNHRYDSSKNTLFCTYPKFNYLLETCGFYLLRANNQRSLHLSSYIFRACHSRFLEYVSAEWFQMADETFSCARHQPHFQLNYFNQKLILQSIWIIIRISLAECGCKLNLANGQLLFFVSNRL